MSLFQCDKCGVIENTALTSGYVGWSSFDGWPAELRLKQGLDVGGKYCSQCFDGKWHVRFEREVYPLGTMETDNKGNVRRKP